MRRLAIIDLSGGSQPIFNEDKSIRVVFNGEIYNYRELRDDLIASGHRFATNSDTEVLVHAYEEYGDDFTRKLNGMFAFALHDMRRKRVLIARDQLGIKPLFFAALDNGIVWGSEIKAVLASGQVPRRLDLDALGEFFAWEYVPGSATLFRDVRKLEPGHRLTVDLKAGTVTRQQYWDISFSPTDTRMNYNEFCDEVDVAVHRAVRRQLVSDVPLGSFLSGGVDSSLVVAAMDNARTFSIGFDDPSYNELAYSKQVADHLGVSHTTRIIKPDAAELFGHLMHFMDDPIGDFSIFPTYLVSKLAREDVTVALSGDGGDELFGGYETYVADAISRKHPHLTNLLGHAAIASAIDMIPPQSKKKGLINKLKRFSEGVRHAADLGHARWRLFAGESMSAALFSDDVIAQRERPLGTHIADLYAKAEDLDPLNRSLYVDTRSYLVDNCLVKTDRMSMAVSLEARVPFLDIDVVDLAFRCPAAFKIRDGQTKSILKTVASRYIPADCVYRPKEGFSIPIKQWLNTEFRRLLDSATNAASLQRDGIFRPETIARLKAEHLGGRANHSHILWSLIVFDAWKTQWLESK